MTRDASLIGVFSAEAGEAPPSWHVPIPARRGGARLGAGRKPGKRDPRLSPSDVALLLASLVPSAVTPSDYARALGCRPERVREALRDGCTVRRADEWKDRTREG